MSYLVMECHPGYAVLLDEEGRFLKAANLRYEVGQTVYNPVLVNEPQKKSSHIVRWMSSGIAAAAACFLLSFGFGYYQNYIQPYSSIYLTINPEIKMDLNRQGTVVKLTGTNEDGKELLEGYHGRGKDKVTAAEELIDRAIEMGFLSAGGQVSFSIDAPDDALFQEYGVELRTGVTDHLDGQVSITIEIIHHQNRQKSPESTPVSSPPETPPASSSPAETRPPQPETAPASSRPAGSGPSQPETAPAPSKPPETAPAPSKPAETQPPQPETPPESSSSAGYGDTDYGPDASGDSSYRHGVSDYRDGGTDYSPEHSGSSNYGSDYDDDGDGSDYD